MNVTLGFLIVVLHALFSMLLKDFQRREDFSKLEDVLVSRVYSCAFWTAGFGGGDQHLLECFEVVCHPPGHDLLGLRCRG